MAAVVLWAFAAYTAIGLVVGFALDRFRNFSVEVQVLGAIIFLAIAILAARLGQGVWRRARSRGRS